MEVSRISPGLIPCLVAGFLLTVPVLSQQFYALDNPCLEKFRLCSTSCRISYMTGSLNCQFCVCDDPKFSIVWPASTTPTTTTTPKPTTTLPEGQWIANNIVYTRLPNPCSEFYAACPLVCKRGHVTYPNGTKCETCNCDGAISSLLGKRDDTPAENQSIEATPKRREKRHAHSHADRNSCFQFHFACPIFRCPEGMTFAISKDGCKECRCIQIETQTTRTTVPMSTTRPLVTVHSKFLQMYCRNEPSDCPTGCSVVDFRVSEWHCYHCHCPDKQFVALQNPCDQQTYLCPDRCQVRHLADHQDQTVSCQFCDCQSMDQILNRNSKVKREISNNCPAHCPGFCHSGNIQDAGIFGRRKRQVYMNQCTGDCAGCLIDRQNTYQSTTQSFSTSTIPSAPTTITPVIKELTADHCIPDYKATDLLRQFCHHISQVSLHNSVCLFCHYRTSNNQLIIVPKSKLQGLLQDDKTTTAYISQNPLTTPTTIPTTSATTKPTTTSTTTTTTPRPKTTTTTTSTTAKPTTTTTTTPSPTTTTTSATTTTKPLPSVPMCHTCAGVNCSRADLQECNTGAEYCMNTLTQNKDGIRTITRGCVSENECFNKWWIITADDPRCLSMKNTPTGQPGQPIECNYCCKGAGCNQILRIPDRKLYTGQDHPSSGMGGIIQIG